MSIRCEMHPQRIGGFMARNMQSQLGISIKKLNRSNTNVIGYFTKNDVNLSEIN